MLQPTMTNIFQTKGSNNSWEKYIAKKAITKFWQKYFTEKVLQILHTNEIQRKVLPFPRLWKVSQYKVLNITVRRYVIMKVSITTPLSHPNLMRPRSVLQSVVRGTSCWESAEPGFVLPSTGQQSKINSKKGKLQHLVSVACVLTVKWLNTCTSEQYNSVSYWSEGMEGWY